MIYTAIQYKGLVRLAMVNPIGAILTQMHSAMIGGVPGTAFWIGGTVRLLVPLGLIAVAFALGLWFFMREAPRIAENL